MKRLFVDCDDTLVIYGDEQDIPSPFGVLCGSPFRINTGLVEFILNFNETNEGTIFIWSGGGNDYAETVTRLLGLDSINPVYLIKDRTTFSLVRPGDIVIDDQDIAVDTEVWKPFDKRISVGSDQW